MPASRGKALPLLRIINAFLRFLPRTPEDLVFRGRVHQFASSVISIADKSAINMRGDYGEVKTTWEEDAVEQTVEGDVEMREGMEGKEPVEAKEGVKGEEGEVSSWPH
jgi:THO complex subunit 1